ncbi:MAG: SUMF1/EgtB/PvdO family nonheme iron enzyme [Phycisphaerae bacterium]|nr:SUMF1/EgtB/PvdO family nonheme iron enzyme [Phycisphaerae bacterium]
MGLGWFATMPSLRGESTPKTAANSIGMTLVRIEPGAFAMGQDKGGDFDERPTHQVTISKPFFIAATEVTNAQYERFDPAHRALRGKKGLCTDDDEPVVFVSWHDAVKYCEWLSKKEGKPYRLPTEAEWEYVCRAGTTTPFNTGADLPEVYQKRQKLEWAPLPVKLNVAKTPANPWGLFDMHGNVEEWCHDWYGPYEAGDQTDPVGREGGDFRVSRGGSHTTQTFYLRSANRLGTLPEDKHWLIGFRVVQGELPKTRPLPKVPPERWAVDVKQDRFDWSGAPEASKPFFKGPIQYVKIPPKSEGPMYSKHNHCPALTACPNGDLLAIWYSTRTEPGRELAIVGTRLRRGSEEWEPAAPFWDGPDRNDHASSLWWDGKDTIYHFNGLCTDATWGKLALVMRTSTDNGATWSKARLINPEHWLRHMPISTIGTKEGYIVLACDAVTGGSGGTAVHVSKDGGKSWVDAGEGKPNPSFKAGGTGAWIAGIHAGVTQLEDGRLMALGRGDTINRKMPRSLSSDMGQTWAYSASPFPPIGGGQRLILKRLREGPLLCVTFTKQTTIKDAAGAERKVSGMFAALSHDSGETWPIRRLITDDKADRQVDGGGNTGWFTLGPNSAEPRGYMACTQTPDNMIHLISSKQYYVFNLAWIKAPMPARD